VRAWLLLAVFGCLLALATGREAAASTTLAFDGFESGNFGGGFGSWNGPWTVLGDVEVVRSGDPHHGGRHLRLRGGTAEATRTVDLAAATGVTLELWAKVDSFEHADTVSLFITGAQGRQGLRTWTAADDAEGYRRYRFAIPSNQLSSAVVVEFEGGMNSPSDRFYVDDIEFIGEDTPATPVPTPTPGPSGVIVLDSSFSDWAGMPNLSDPFGDGQGGRDERGDGRDEDGERRPGDADLHLFFWANNVGEEANYWMVQRHTIGGQPYDGPNGQHSPVEYVVHIDANDNGRYGDRADRKVRVEYLPTGHGSRVTVSVRAGDGRDRGRGDDDEDGWRVIFRNRDWGDSQLEGGLRVEFYVPWSELGIEFGQSLRMYVTSDDDRLPDHGDVQWSPASVLGHVMLGLAAAAGIFAVWWFRGRRAWRSR
jgi:hypothetical protein